jgi:hypothetical protein
LAKRFVWEKLSKKVQFLQPNNDDMIKRCTQWHRGTWTMMPMTSLLSRPRLYCRLSKVRWTCWGADMRWQSRVKSFVVKLYVLLDVHLLAMD